MSAIVQARFIYNLFMYFLYNEKLQIYMLDKTVN